jgi:hypothetical protein
MDDALSPIDEIPPFGAQDFQMKYEKAVRQAIENGCAIVLVPLPPTKLNSRADSAESFESCLIGSTS